MFSECRLIKAIFSPRLNRIFKKLRFKVNLSLGSSLVTSHRIVGTGCGVCGVRRSIPFGASEKWLYSRVLNLNVMNTTTDRLKSVSMLQGSEKRIFMKCCFQNLLPYSMNTLKGQALRPDDPKFAMSTSTEMPLRGKDQVRVSQPLSTTWKVKSTKLRFVWKRFRVMSLT